MSETTDHTEAPAEAISKAAKSSRLPKVILIVCAVLGLLLGGLLLTARYGVVLPQGRLLLEAQLEGLKIGRFGRLKIEGLEGDVWRNFTVRRLTVADEQGVWLEARNVAVSWRYLELLRRRMHADEISAEQLTLIRRPTLTPKTESRGLPISFVLDKVTARVEMLPEFSYRRGLYDLSMSLDVQRRNRGQTGEIAARSLLHEGDRLNFVFDMGKTRPLLLELDAVEAQGGALAGALGFPADQPFALQVRAQGQNGRGDFRALARTGETTPLEAQGAWAQAGGAAQGRLLLTASQLTRGLAERLGPEVSFNAVGREAGGGLHQIELDAASANLRLVARGRADVGARRTGPAGLAVTLSTAELSRLTGGPEMGATQLSGTLRGSLEDLRFEGAGEVARLRLGGYGLERVSGPVELTRRRGELSLAARLSGAGGRGEGYLAALLGARPTATVQGARLGDGRLMLRDIQVTGPGLRVQASGGRSLLGGLNFRGTADVSNLAAARAGASGTLRAEWSAAQGGAGRPWNLSVDAQGRQLALGFSELDRLLGAAPRLTARGEIQGRRLALSQARLDGAELNAAAAGVWDRGEGMRFKLDWDANGPFRAGPVEITGRASGSGAITGVAAAPRLDMTADLEAVDVPRLPLRDGRLTLSFMRRQDGSAGVAALEAQSAYGPARARSAFRFPRGGVDLTELSLDAGGVTAEGALSLRRGAPSAADLRVRVARGAFLEGGEIAGTARIVDAAGGPTADIDLAARNAVLPGARLAIRDGRVSAEGPMARLPYTAALAGNSAEGRWSLAGRGLLAEEEGGRLVTFDGSGRFGRRELRTVETAQIRFGEAGRSARLRMAASDGGRIELDARLARNDADIRARLDGLGLGLLNEDLSGSADAVLTLTGEGGRLQGVLDAQLTDARGRGSPAIQGLDGVFQARLGGERLLIQAALSNEQGLRATADVILPTETSVAPLRLAIVRNRPIDGRFFADGDVRPLWDLFVGGERELAGRVRLSGNLGGTLADPTATGEAQVDGGRFSDGATGLVLQDVTLRAAFTDNVVDVTQARGTDGAGGSLSGAGRISLLRQGASTFRLDLRNFRLIDNDLATASASGQATLNRNAEGRVRLSGDLTIDRADVTARVTGTSGVVNMDVIEINKPVDVSGALQPVRTGGPAVALDVRLRAPRRIFVRGRGLDVELSLDAQVGGTTARPALSGTARVVRGDYDFAGKRFEFDERGVVYLATSPEAIRLDLTATREDPALTAVVRVRGTAARPEITLTSEPVLPNDEVLSQVLFGRSASQLSALEAAQLASALSALAGGGGFDVIGNLRSFAGLDRLALAGGDESGVTVAGGKYLTDDVYLELIGGGREGPVAQVEWQVRRNLSIISRIAGQGDGRLAVRWRRDY
ncbi:MAG: translocation/assembly module TamB domain-containing protein [Phenylobacterium sp.]|uniref:translocation/assembly module TamB domain-containing protein n=1 Tax=Phenylobacterium sp. TaxID=1871053 RepID=UPI00391B8BC4